MVHMMIDQAVIGMNQMSTACIEWSHCYWHRIPDYIDHIRVVPVMPGIVRVCIDHTVMLPVMMNRIQIHMVNNRLDQWHWQIDQLHIQHMPSDLIHPHSYHMRMQRMMSDHWQLPMYQEHMTGMIIVQCNWWRYPVGTVHTLIDLVDYWHDLVYMVSMSIVMSMIDRCPYHNRHMWSDPSHSDIDLVSMRYMMIVSMLIDRDRYHMRHMSIERYPVVMYPVGMDSMKCYR
jgi:hypothetical protein